MWKKFKFFAGLLAASGGCVSSGLAQEFVAALPAAPEGTAAEPQVLSVEALVARVRSATPEALVQRESVRRALERSYQRRAELLPQFALRAEQTRQQLGSGFAGDTLRAPPFNSFTARVEGSLKVIDTQAYADWRLAQLEHAITEMDYEVAVQDIMEQALLIYFTHLRDLRRIEIVEGNIDRYRELLRLASEQFEAGTAVKIDVTRAEVRLATERRELMEARTAAESSILELKALLDIPVESELLLDRSIIEGIKAPPSLKRYGGMAPLTEVRPELKSRQRVLDQAILARKAAGWQRLPTVELFANWGYDSGEPFDDREGEAWLLGVRASIPIFEGFRISAEKREADAAIRQNEYQLRDLRNRIEREFRTALIEMDSRYEQIEIARDEIRLGRLEVEQASERYREGLADNRELIDAQQRLSDAESSQLRSIYLYGLGRLSFARSIGATERVLE